MKTVLILIVLLNLILNKWCVCGLNCSEDLFIDIQEIKDSKTKDDVIDLNFIEYKIDILCANSVSDISELYKLKFASNGIKRIHKGAFKNLPRLETLVITGNDIRTILKDVFISCSNIKELDLSGNNILTIKAKAFDALPNLEVLRLANNKLTAISPKWFRGSPKIRQFVASYNRVGYLRADNFAGFADGVPVEIFLDNNRIEVVAKGNFRGIEMVRNISLANNRIGCIEDSAFVRIREMENLDLSGNQVTCLSNWILNGLRVKRVNLDGNPIGCEDCVPRLERWANKTGVECVLGVRKSQCQQTGA